SDDALRRIRRALRIGPAGFGKVVWQGEAGGPTGSALASFKATWLLLLGVALFSARFFGPFGALAATAPLALAIRLAWKAHASLSPPRVVLTEHGVIATDSAGRTVRAAYAEVVDANVGASGSLVIRTVRRTIELPTPGWVDFERRCVAALVESGAERARHGYEREPAVPTTLAFLERRGESSRRWLERVDAVASALSSADAYRRPHVPVADLLTALESPDASPAVRGAAARVLARIAPGEATTRVAEALASERDPHARDVIHIALEENIEAAAASLDELARD
ncbi:MAG: hypothetical protein FWD17_16065, partial [Polyangiaceae bacterium]|nr:hypothetical protein [Polyangiaceae bacterium]